MNKTCEDSLCIAKFGRCVGLDGYLKLNIFSDFPEQFKKDAIFSLKNGEKITIQTYKKDRNIVKIIEAPTLGDAKKLVNKELFTSVEASKKLINLKENQYFWFDIIGLEVQEEDEILGKVEDIARYPLGDYLEITSQKELVSQDLAKVFLIPYNDTYIINVDLETKIIQVQKAKEILENS